MEHPVTQCHTKGAFYLFILNDGTAPYSIHTTQDFFVHEDNWPGENIKLRGISSYPVFVLKAFTFSLNHRTPAAELPRLCSFIFNH